MLIKPTSRPSYQYNRQGNSGFTLVEIVAVLVILSIVGVIGSRFLLISIDSYNTIQQRSKLIAKAQVSIEQMARQLRQSVPNAVRISGSGNCVEFLPALIGVRYLGLLPDSANGAPAVSLIPTAGFTLPSGSADHVLVAPLRADEVYTVGSSRVGVGAFGAGPIYTAIPLASSHQFLRNSLVNRVVVAENPKRFCLSAGNLLRYSGYGLLTSGLNDAAPAGSASAIMARNVNTSSVAFSLSDSSVNRNAVVNISLDFTEGSQTVALNQQVFVRNVP